MKTQLMSIPSFLGCDTVDFADQTGKLWFGIKIPMYEGYEN